MFCFKRYISVLLASAIFLSVVAVNKNLTANAETITYAEIYGSYINIRSSMSTSGNNKIGQINPTSQPTTVYVRVLENNGEWLRILYNSLDGYIYNDSEWVKRIYTVDTENTDKSFEEQLAKFPESYRAALTALHAQYPNWVFIADPVAISFSEAVRLESTNRRKLVGSTYYKESWRSMDPTSYDWFEGTWEEKYDPPWYGASREVVAYYMDPRNFLDANYIFAFMHQGYDPTYQTEEGIKKIIAGTFMEDNYSDPNDTEYGGSYAKVIMAAAQKWKVNPYIIVAKIRQEVATANKGYSSIVSGTYGGYGHPLYGYYNFFNIKATGDDPIYNGLLYAKEQGWTTRSAAIIGGAEFLSDKYIANGQDTYYYQDYNVHNVDNINHQYAEAVFDPHQKGYGASKAYIDDPASTVTFKIPVYSSMPDTPPTKPEHNNNLNNYYFTELSVSGLAPTFKMDIYDYTLSVNQNTAIKFSVPETAQYLGEEEYPLTAGENIITLTVKAQSGYTTDYKISVLAETPCTLYVNTTGTVPSGGTEPEPPPVPTYKLGDINDDGKISISDLGTVKLHLLGRYTISGDAALAADVNKDGKISISDLGTIKLHLLGRYQITD